MTILDWSVLIAYFVGITAFGLWVSRKIRSTGGYFLGDRDLPWWVMVGQSFGTGTHAENPVAQTGATYHFGFATIWYQWKNMLITPFYWLMAPWYRRCERTTIGEVMEDRYGRGMAMFYTVFAMCYFVFNQGTMMKGAGKVISTATGELVQANEVVMLMVAAFLLYSFFGGLVASAYTDFVQGFLIIAMSFMLIPAGLWAVGGISGMRDLLTTPRVEQYIGEVEQNQKDKASEAQLRIEQLQAEFDQTIDRFGDSLPGSYNERQRIAGEIEAAQAELAAAKRRPVVPGDRKGTDGFFDLYNEASKVTLFAILMLTLNGLIGITAQPHILSMNATGKTERAGRIGQTYGSFVKRACTIGWAFTGLIVAAMVVQSGVMLKDSEEAFGHACKELLGSGLLGLMVACVLAANMSTCSNFMVNSGALFTKNFYQPYMRPDATEKELLLAGRLSGLGLTLGGVVFALGVGQVLDAFMFNETLPAFIGIAVLGGFLWKRANRYGAFAGIAAALVVYYGFNYLLSCAGTESIVEFYEKATDAWLGTDGANMHRFLTGGELKLVYKWLAVPYGLATLAGICTFIVVSLATPAEPLHRIEEFFDRMNHSSDSDPAPGGRKRPAGQLGQELILLDVPGWFTAARWRPFWSRYREDAIGFVLAWGAVGALVLSAWALMQLFV